MNKGQWYLVYEVFSRLENLQNIWDKPCLLEAQTQSDAIEEAKKKYKEIKEGTSQDEKRFPKNMRDEVRKPRVVFQIEIED